MDLGGLQMPGESRVVALTTAVTTGVLIAGCPAARAADGITDPSFGPQHNGTVLTATALNGLAAATALQPDGKIIVAGSSSDGGARKLTLVRYTAAGIPDPGFGTGGSSLTALGDGKSSTANAVVVQPDGKIVTAGATSDGGRIKFTVARFTTDGKPDPAFGTGGSVFTAFGASKDATASALALQQDGKIVAAGVAVLDSSKAGFALARYNPDGTLDSSFATAGVSIVGLSSSGKSAAGAVALQPDGKIIAAGAATVGDKTGFALARYTPAGAIDPSFGTGGATIETIGSETNATAASVLLQPDGSIVAGGFAQEGKSIGYALAEFTAAGAIATGFGTGGATVALVGDGGSAAAGALVRQPDGRLLLAGTSLDGGKRKFAVERFTAAGAPDVSFGSGGSVQTLLGDGALATAAARQPDGKLVVAGSAKVGDTLQFALVRYDLGAGSAG